MKLSWNTIIGSAALAFAVNANAGLIDFNGFEHGTVINDQYASEGLLISADNLLAFKEDYAVAYDSTNRKRNKITNADKDLNGPSWGAGNMGDSNMELGGLLIIQENDIGCDTGVCSVPDDEGFRPAGSLFFGFDEAISSFGFDVIDVEKVGEAPKYHVSFYSDFDVVGGQITVDNSDKVGQVNFEDLVGHNGVEFGNNSFNRLEPFWFDDPKLVKAVQIRMGGSGGVDNLVFSVSEPSAIALLVLGMGGIVALRRRREV